MSNCSSDSTSCENYFPPASPDLSSAQNDKCKVKQKNKLSSLSVTWNLLNIFRRKHTQLELIIGRFVVASWVCRCTRDEILDHFSSSLLLSSLALRCVLSLLHRSKKSTRARQSEEYAKIFFILAFVRVRRVFKKCISFSFFLTLGSSRAQEIVFAEL